jgi:MFS transporter, PPP family, 3-phenylpropionic acid transporter
MNKLAVVRHHSSSIRLASLQFLSLAAVGMVAPYTNLYLVEIGFSATLIGTLASIGAILALSLTPVLNNIADKRLLHRRLYMLYLAGFVVANIIFATSNTHFLIVVAVLLLKVTISPSLTLGMQLTMTQLATRSKSMLGQIRSFAAMGFSAASLLAGQLFSVGGYPLLFWVGAIFATLSIQFATIFPAKPKIKEEQSDEAPVARRRGLYVMLASQFFAMMGIQNSFAFMFVHFTQNLGIPTAEIGIWAALLAAVEIPFFILMDSILPKVKFRQAYVVGILGMAVFIFLMGTTQSLLVLALLIVFRGVIWPSLHLSSFAVVSAISHPQNVATNQAILQVTMPSLAMLLTGSAFGWVFDHLGAFAFFGLCALMCVIGAGIMMVGYRMFDVNPEPESE